jgi:hypothetical protein
MQASATSDLRALLAAGRNADGGWGYYPDKTSRLEPTCWVLLAEQEAYPGVLQEWPAADGLLLERPGGQPNFAFHALGILTLLARGVEHASGNQSLVRGLERVHGIPLDQSDVNRQDNSIQAWSWIDDTFSWVEPTAWALLALEAARHRGLRVDPARVRDARALLVDRCCRTGGWNYGNANMLGKDLRPYVPTTAVALMALRETGGEVVERSLAWLGTAAASEHSALALSLAILALRRYGVPAGTAHEALAAQVRVTLDLRTQLAAAMAVCALRGPSSGDWILGA